MVEYAEEMVVDERINFISTMILKYGFNPEAIIRKVEEGFEKIINYEIGGISIFREDDSLVARIENKYISDEPILYKWK